MQGPGSTSRTVIVGGGLTGISAAMHLDGAYLLIERSMRLGGLATTETRDGFSFDHTGHWLHLRDDYIRRMVLDLLGDELVEVARIARIYSYGRTTRYPFQGNLHGLPPDVIHECLLGLFKAKIEADPRAGEPKNFDEFIRFHFGEGIAKHFMVPYNAKLWGVHPRELTSAWCNRFVPKPNVEQIIAGAVGAGPPELGYNVRFLYPRTGGISTFSAALAGTLDAASIAMETVVDKIDERARTVTVDGEAVPYTAMVSTMPLPDLVAALSYAPAEVVAATKKLRATSMSYLNVAARTESPAEWHWIYVPEERLPFYRVGCFTNAMPSMAPPGCSSFYVELAPRTEPDEGIVKLALDGMVEVGAIRSVDDVVFADVRTISPAYVIFDDDYQAALDTIFPYLEAHRIISRGRYGAWIYNSMEDSLLAGKDAAERVNAMATTDEGAR